MLSKSSEKKEMQNLNLTCYKNIWLRFCTENSRYYLYQKIVAFICKQADIGNEKLRLLVTPKRNKLRHAKSYVGLQFLRVKKAYEMGLQAKESELACAQSLPFARFLNL